MENLEEQYNILDKASKKQKRIYTWILIAGSFFFVIVITNLIISLLFSEPANNPKIASLKIENDFLSQHNYVLTDSIKLLSKQISLIDTFSKKDTIKKLFVFTDMLLEYSENFHSWMTYDSKGGHEIRLDKAPDYENVSKVLYIWGKEDSEQIISSKKDSYAKFKTQKPITIDDIEIWVFYKTGKLIIWKRN